MNEYRGFQTLQITTITNVILKVHMDIFFSGKKKKKKLSFLLLLSLLAHPLVVWRYFLQLLWNYIFEKKLGINYLMIFHREDHTITQRFLHNNRTKMYPLEL